MSHFAVEQTQNLAGGVHSLIEADGEIFRRQEALGFADRERDVLIETDNLDQVRGCRTGKRFCGWRFRQLCSGPLAQSGEDLSAVIGRSVICTPIAS